MTGNRRAQRIGAVGKGNKRARRIEGEGMRVNKSAYGSTITPYTGGMNGWVPMLQTIFSF